MKFLEQLPQRYSKLYVEQVQPPTDEDSGYNVSTRQVLQHDLEHCYWLHNYEPDSPVCLVIPQAIQYSENKWSSIHTNQNFFHFFL